MNNFWNCQDTELIWNRNSTPVSIGQEDKHTQTEWVGVRPEERGRDRRAEMPPWRRPRLLAANDGKVGRVRGKKDALGDK